MQEVYVYAYLDPRKKCALEYSNVCFLYEPFYIGQGIGNRYKNHLNIINHHECKRSKLEWKFNPEKCKILTDIYIETKSYPFIEKIAILKSRDEANLEEEKYINLIKRKTDGGYLTNILKNHQVDNSVKKGKTLEELYGKEKSDEIKRKLSVSSKAMLSSPEMKEKIKALRTGKTNPKARKISQFNLDGTFIKEFEYINQAVKELNLIPAAKNAIIGVARGRRHKAYGFIWKYS